MKKVYLKTLLFFLASLASWAMILGHILIPLSRMSILRNIIQSAPSYCIIPIMASIIYFREIKTKEIKALSTDVLKSEELPDLKIQALKTDYVTEGKRTKFVSAESSDIDLIMPINPRNTTKLKKQTNSLRRLLFGYLGMIIGFIGIILFFPHIKAIGIGYIVGSACWLSNEVWYDNQLSKIQRKLSLLFIIFLPLSLVMYLIFRTYNKYEYEIKKFLDELRLIIDKYFKNNRDNISELSDNLTKLYALKEKGILTEEEFTEQKRKHLKQ